MIQLEVEAINTVEYVQVMLRDMGEDWAKIEVFCRTMEKEFPEDHQEGRQSEGSQEEQEEQGSKMV